MKMHVLITTHFTAVLLLAASLSAAEPAKTSPRFDPVKLKIEGWTVYAEPLLVDGKYAEEGQQALKMLGNHLQRIAVLVPEERLAELRKLEIWIEHQHPELGTMQYHPDVGWLKSHGYDPRLAKKVHIPKAAVLTGKQLLVKHPMVILHELAHSYHDQVLGFEREDIVEAYQQAKKAGTYEKVLLFNGRRERHYGLTNHKEYFAEGTEAYFYRNDFYPFVAAELAEHDPTLYSILSKIWGS